MINTKKMSETKSYHQLYDKTDVNIMKWAEDSLNPKVDRIEEIILFAKESGIKHLGIANCISFQKEAEWLHQYLNDSGFIVSRINCKHGRMPMSDIIADYKGVSCNPAGQAQYLEEKNTELNIMMGLCLGHDMVFNAKSKAPVTPLIVKDRALGHHTLKKMDTKD